MNFIKAFIPNALTLLNLLCGFMILLINDLFVIILLFCLSLIFDLLDGFIARLLKVQSDLGKELDSIADVVSFGVVPAFLYYKIAPEHIGWVSYIASGMIVTASGYRLAKFNLLPSSNYFRGLNTPSSAIFFIGLYIAYIKEKAIVINLFSNTWIYILIPLIFVYLLNSPLKMFSLKGLSKRVFDNKYQITLVLLVVICLFLDPILAISGSIISYILLSVVLHLSEKN